MDLVLLCVSKEAIFCAIHYTVKKGSNYQLYCTSPGFLIYASHLVRKGWLVTRCEICDTESAIDTQPNTHQNGSCSPLRTNMIVPLIATTIAEMANSNMSPLAFAILYRNKNTSNWTKFWDYVLKLHPLMNSGDITIITDQDKGQKMQ